MKNANGTEIESGATMWSYFPIRRVTIADNVTATTMDEMVWVNLKDDRLDGVLASDLFDSAADAADAAISLIEEDYIVDIGAADAHRRRQLDQLRKQIQGAS